MVFGCGQSPSSVLSICMAYSLYVHKPYSFRTPHFLPTTGGNQKSMLITKRSLYFSAALWWERHLLAFTVAEHRTDAMFCWHMPPDLIQVCHAKQPTPELRPVLHTPGRIHGKRMAQDGGDIIDNFFCSESPVLAVQSGLLALRK
jgi:hypothetical protein